MFALALVLVQLGGLAAPAGIPPAWDAALEPATHERSRLPSDPAASIEELELVRAFEGQSWPEGFGVPVAVGLWPTGGSGSNDASELHYIADRKGHLVLFGKETPARVVLKLDVGISHRAEGLLGLAFHPRFRSDRRLFVHFTDPKARRSVIASVQLDESPDDASPPRFDSESLERLLEFEQPWQDHNGGPLAFGADGALYVAVGDGGSRGDPRGHAQNPNSLLGAILRLDVNGKSKSPGEALGVFGRGARAEVFAIGLRDPRALFLQARRLSDQNTSRGGEELFVFDSGSEHYDELSTVMPGDNLGWPLHEGFVDFAPRANQGPGERRDPLAVFSHKQVSRSTTGCVYEGMRHPGLRGHFVFAGEVSGQLIALKLPPPGSESAPGPERVGQLSRPCVVGVGSGGELLIADREGHLWSTR